MTISRTYVEVCFNLSYYVDSFCSDVRDSNPLDEINCTAQSLNGIDCPGGVCPCNTTILRRRLLSAETNLTTLITYKEPIKPVIEPKQTWITAIVVREVILPPRITPAQQDSSIVLIGAAIGALLVLGIGIGVPLGIWCSQRQKYEPVQQTAKAVRSDKKIPKFIADIKIR